MYISSACKLSYLCIVNIFQRPGKGSRLQAGKHVCERWTISRQDGEKDGQLAEKMVNICQTVELRFLLEMHATPWRE